MLTHRWHTLAESQFPWEQEALLYLRERLPDQEPVRAWANADFVSLDGRMNEVDVIVLTAKGLFLVEIKSRPGEVSGDQQRWTWKDGASQFDLDNPLRLANLKAKRLADLLGHQKVVGSACLPFVEPLVFCSAPGVRIKLPSPFDRLESDAAALLARQPPTPPPPAPAPAPTDGASSIEGPAITSPPERRSRCSMTSRARSTRTPTRV